LLYVIGIAGLYMLLRSTRMAYRPRQAYILLMLGVVVLLIVVYYTSTMLQDKITTS
jgi:type II secretory pathway component PulM